MTSSPFPQHLSPTSIDRWRVCPRRFFYQDVQRLPFEESRTLEQTLGDVVHKVLESLFRIEPAKRNPEMLERLVEWNVLRFSTRAMLREDEKVRLGDEARRQLLEYVRSSDMEARPLKLEQPFRLRLSNGTTITTRVDRIDRGLSGLLEVTDYKTGRHQIDEQDLARETAAIVQLHAIGKASDQPVEKVTWRYLRSGDVVSWWPEAEDVDAATDRLIGVLRKMHRDLDYDPNPGPQCTYCPFRGICPTSPGESRIADAA
jgi:RecB family exonuclease